VELHRVAFLAPGRAGLVGGAVGHDHVDGVVIRVDIGLHVGLKSNGRRSARRAGIGSWAASYNMNLASARAWRAVLSVKSAAIGLRSGCCERNGQRLYGRYTSAI